MFLVDTNNVKSICEMASKKIRGYQRNDQGYTLKIKNNKTKKETICRAISRKQWKDGLLVIAMQLLFSIDSIGLFFFSKLQIC